MQLFTKIVFTFTAILLIGCIAFVTYAFEKRNPSELQLCGWGKTLPYYRATGYYQKDFIDFKEFIYEKSLSSKLSPVMDSCHSEVYL